METESEPYVRLATLRRLHEVIAELNAARNLAETLQAIVDGIVDGLGFEIAVVNLVRPDGDLEVAAVAGGAEASHALAGEVGSRESWDRLLAVGEQWGTLVFVGHDRSWAVGPDIPLWIVPNTWPDHHSHWHPHDVLLAPMYNASGELLGVISVDRPRNGKRPGPWGREALQLYTSQAAIAITNARLRANMRRALTRLEREQQQLRASEESFRQAFEFAPSGMAIAEFSGVNEGLLVHANDALCRLLGRPPTHLARLSFKDLVHPEDRRLLERTSAEGGRAELRISRRDGSYLWVLLRNSVVADTADGPRFLLTHVEDIEERKRHELQLAHRASHDALTGLPNGAELRARLSQRLCSSPPLPGDSGAPPEPDPMGGFPLSAGFNSAGTRYERHTHTISPDADPVAAARGAKGLAVLFCDLNGFKLINDEYGHHAGDAVLVEVAKRLSSAVREGDTVARLGGDEFVVLADGLTTDDATDLVVRLRGALSPPIRIDGRTLRVGASFGLGWASCGQSVDEVLKSADERMYDDKRARSKSHRRAG